MKKILIVLVLLMSACTSHHEVEEGPIRYGKGYQASEIPNFCKPAKEDENKIVIPTPDGISADTAREIVTCAKTKTTKADSKIAEEAKKGLQTATVKCSDISLQGCDLRSLKARGFEVICNSPYATFSGDFSYVIQRKLAKLADDRGQCWCSINWYKK